MLLPPEIFHDLLHRVWIKASVDHLSVLEKRLHGVLIVTVACMDAQPLMRVIEEVVGDCGMIKETESSSSVVGEVISFEHRFISEVCFCDKVRLSESRIDELLIMMVIARTPL